MSLSFVRIMFALGLLTSTACVARSLSAAEISLNEDTREVIGWFSAKGEWMLFPDQNIKRYNPYGLKENTKCVSLINDTGKPRSSFEKLSGRQISVRGYIAVYDTLSDGDSVADTLLSKRYFKGNLVENSCLRRYVFIANEIKLR